MGDMNKKHMEYIIKSYMELNKFGEAFRKMGINLSETSLYMAKDFLIDAIFHMLNMDGKDVDQDIIINLLGDENLTSSEVITAVWKYVEK